MRREEAQQTPGSPLHVPLRLVSYQLRYMQAVYSGFLSRKHAPSTRDEFKTW